MRVAVIPKKDNTQDRIKAYTVLDFPYEKLNTNLLKHKTTKKSNKRKLYEAISTFDIETTTIEETDEKPFGFMYHWQQVVDGIVCYGRTWQEWLEFMDILHSIYTEGDLVIYVHNLAYEFQFIKDFLSEHFDNLYVFSAKSRKPIRSSVDGFEFRCSYFLSNMTLNKATKEELGCEHIKADGDLDYTKFRTPSTKLTITEFGYCIADVVSLYDYIIAKLKNDNDTLYTIPMTSTGYVRRDCRNSCKESKSYRYNIFLKLQFKEKVYKMLSEASRGGDTHANRFLSNKVFNNVDSYDATSEYPSVMILKKFPMTEFYLYSRSLNEKEFRRVLDGKGYACLFRAYFSNIRAKDTTSMPNISQSKCFMLMNQDLDNGRVLSSDFLATTITDLDFYLIDKQYDWDEMEVRDLYVSTYGYLPEEITSVIMEYFTEKCKLKMEIKKEEKRLEKEGKKTSYRLEELNYLYAKSKNKLNGIFGMCYTDPVREEVTYDGQWGKISKDELDIEDKLNKFFNSRNSFVLYQWGVWTTAWGRIWLDQLRSCIGDENSIYSDTDSVKGKNVDNSKVEKLNESIKKLCEERHAYCDIDGVRFYMGVYEHENKKPITNFKTMGAKKYVYMDDKGFHVTISGVSKKYGAKELKSVDNFVTGFIFTKAAGSELHYNDENIHTININGEEILTASNIGMTQSTYKVNMTGDYLALLDEINNNELWVDGDFIDSIA